MATVRHGVSDARRRWRRAAFGRAGNAGVAIALELAFVWLASLAWTSTSVPESVDLTLMGVSAAVGVPVAATIGVANIAAARAARAHRAPGRARSLASAGLWLAIVRILAFASAVILVIAITDPQPDGRWRIHVAFLIFALLEMLLVLALAVLTRIALGARFPAGDHP